MKTFLSTYNPVSAPVHMEMQEVLALFRTIWKIGIFSPARGYYWDLIFWTLINYPKTAAGHHIHGVLVPFQTG